MSTVWHLYECGVGTRHSSTDLLNPQVCNFSGCNCGTLMQRKNETKDAVIASNWFRRPLPVIYADRDSGQSWEKQQVWRLDNGYVATVEYNPTYGDLISRIDHPEEGTYWHCSNGIDSEPAQYSDLRPVKLYDFARPWIEEIRNDHGVIATLVLPKWRYRR